MCFLDVKKRNHNGIWAGYMFIAFPKLFSSLASVPINSRRDKVSFFMEIATLDLDMMIIMINTSLKTWNVPDLLGMMERSAEH